MLSFNQLPPDWRKNSHSLGKDRSAELRKLFPHPPIIITTGCGDNDYEIIDENGKAFGTNERLQGQLLDLEFSSSRR